MFQETKSNIEVINELYRAGALKSFVRSGLFPAKILLHMEIYYYVCAKMEVGIRKTHAVNEAAVQFNLDDRTIFRIIVSISNHFTTNQ